jgi:hypothetical protein
MSAIRSGAREAELPYRANHATKLATRKAVGEKSVLIIFMSTGGIFMFTLAFFTASL